MQATDIDEQPFTFGPVHKQAIRDILARLASDSGFKKRRGQNHMIAAVAKTVCRVEGTHVLAIEGPTGTGKSLGYLIGAAYLAKRLRRPLIVATATVNLQMQLAEDDLPKLAKVMTEPITWAVAKGRRRYVCDHRIQTLGASDPDQSGFEAPGFDGLSSQWPYLPTQRDRNTVEKMTRLRDSHAWDGDLDAWDGVLSARLRSAITVGAHACLGKACSQIHRCPLYQARERQRKADIIITNHAQLITAIAHPLTSPLPPLDSAIVIVDEGHHLATAARAGFTETVKLWAAKSQFDKTIKAVRAVGGDATSCDALVEDLLEIGRQLGELGQQAVAEGWIQNDKPARLDETARSAVSERANHIIPALDRSGRRLQSLTERVKKDKKSGALQIPSGANWLALLAEAQARVESLMTLFDWVLRASNSMPVAVWCERVKEKSKRSPDTQLAAALINVAPLLRSRLFERAYCTVVTSATLQAMGSFRRIKAQCGMPADTATLAIDHPFDLERQGVLCVPVEATDPRAGVGHTTAVVRAVVRSLKAGSGALTLFTSKVQMRTVHSQLPEHVQRHVRMQHEKPTPTLVAEHRNAIESGQPSILFGLASMAEGLDLPGALCECVLVARIPFTVPDGPIEQTAAEWIQAQGRNPFIEMSCPDAHRRLVQMMGRLIRSETDRGEVQLLDRRILTKPYGRRMWETMPGFSRRIECARPVKVAEPSRPALSVEAT
jgi:ATP-dependent DNA helicase DinG